jgi:hypothetical protein
VPTVRREVRRADGLWRSLVAHLTGGQGVAGSNPVSPTKKPPLTCGNVGRSRQVNHDADHGRSHPGKSGTVTISGHHNADLPNPGLDDGVLLDASAQHAGRTGREVLTSSTIRSGFWLIVSIAISAVLATVGVILWAPDDQLTYSTFATAIRFPVVIILPLIAILAVTSEWNQRSRLSTFTLIPHRSRIITAKAISAVVIAIAAMVLIQYELSPATGVRRRFRAGQPG